MTVEPGQTLSHYSLIEKIGEGGMGVVWKAQDKILGRTVAIKVLPADFASDEHRRSMFLKEARLASSVSDAHIAQVYELGREAGLDFIVMEYVEGKALNRILHGRPLPPEKVAQLGHQIAQALARAHRKGLLHRDLKPSNILVTPDGEAKVVDFGLATLFERRDTTSASTATTVTETSTDDVEPKPPARVGTIPYMSPEQARAETLDARSDIFSLGVVLYEMTTGQRPFSGSTGVALLKEIVRAHPRPPHELLPKMPLDLDRIIQKALAPTKTDRYQTMDDLAVDLKHLGRDLESGSSPSFDQMRDALRPISRSWLWVLSSAIGLALVAGGAWGWFATKGIAPDPRTILILPMEVRGQTEGNDYVGQAFAEAIAVNLARAKDLKVLPVPSAHLNAGKNPTAADGVASAQGAGRLLKGALTRNGKAIHASVSLVDVAANRILWGTETDSAEGDLSTLASSLALDTVRELGGTIPKQYDYVLNLTGGPAMSASPVTAEAVGALRRNDDRAALESTKRLVGAFPSEPAAAALRAQALMRTWHATPSAENRIAVEESISALDHLDTGNPYGGILRSYLLSEGDGQHRQAIETLTTILSRDDLTPAARSWVLRQRSTPESTIGENAAAIADLEESLRLEPASHQVFARLSGALALEGRFEEALAHARQAVALNPNSWFNYTKLGLVLIRLRRWDEARAAHARACELSHAQEACALVAVDLEHMGRRSEAMAAAADAGSLTESAFGMYDLGCFWALAGDRGEALRHLRRSIELGKTDVTLADDPDLVSLHGDPAFVALVTDLRSRAHAVPAVPDTRTSNPTR